jgi:hypothetical protein
MSALPLRRIQHRKTNGQDRTETPSHGELRVDIEQFTMPQSQTVLSSLASWGIADAFSVSATVGQQGVSVEPAGVAIDGLGRVITVAAGGLAVVDPDADPTSLSVDTVTVVAGQPLVVTTENRDGDHVLVVQWREVQRDIAGTPNLVGAPWLHLLEAGGFVDDGSTVVLARVSIAAGAVQTLSADGRRLVGTPTSALQLRTATVSAGKDSVAQRVSARLSALPSGGIELDLVDPGGSVRPVLSIDAGTGNVVPAHAIAIGVDPGKAQRPLHVEGNEIHSGGKAGGFSFADRTTGSFLDQPTAGQRWVWYASSGAARLWSGEDQLSISLNPDVNGPALDVLRRMRVRQGKSASAGIWFFQGNADQGFVGLQDNSHIGFWGNSGANWGLTMDTTNGSVAITNGLTVGSTQPAHGPFHFTPGGMAVLTDAVGVLHVRQGTFQQAAAVFDGVVHVNGSLSKPGGSFRIDHPLDPQNKYLSHSFVESPEMLNIYAGHVVTDAQGQALIELPAYFEALNRDFCYQLCAIGQAAVASVVKGIRDNKFTIETDKPDVQVSWQVTGVRKDRWAEQNRVVVEEDKTGDQRGGYLHPSLFDEPARQMRSQT